MARERTTKPKGRTGGRWGGGRFVARRKVCTFCANKSTRIDYKDVALLGRYLQTKAKILQDGAPATVPGIRAVAAAIKERAFWHFFRTRLSIFTKWGSAYELSRPHY